MNSSILEGNNTIPQWFTSCKIWNLVITDVFHILLFFVFEQWSRKPLIFGSMNCNQSAQFGRTQWGGSIFIFLFSLEAFHRCLIIRTNIYFWFLSVTFGDFLHPNIYYAQIHSGEKALHAYKQKWIMQGACLHRDNFHDYI